MMKTSSLFFKNQCMLPESYEDALKIPKFDGVGMYGPNLTHLPLRLEFY